ncbi:MULTISPECIES: cobalamin-binding protein [Burkholderia]|uniref:cobalamin-binding protein n=1 Tax=Burkholderia TaxID=32008 RepID=UPI001D128434|nr:MULTISPECIES: cobalamin-binding protein [Burkholderia]MCH7274445.1 cobalamin-binding protein [Burkholderia gladioli]MDN7727791.1 cobalamin-binding protein [Burkholderia gladioli]MDN7739694.1 cobalamin-binding protein [Burkholderia gladioli]MDZ4040394.1 cobalamin-binding protein [Burkholderia gladioli pv. alliicola]MEB2551688.1 cobalamin-binding protein [Burkholderia gladioli]
MLGRSFAGGLVAALLAVPLVAPVAAAPASVASASSPAVASATSATNAITVIDDAGRIVTLSAPARRVISVAPHATELLYAAGGAAAMVGAVSYSDYPEAARALPRVGDNRSLDLERIVALKPDLIVVWRHGNADRQTAQLAALGIPLYFSEPKRLDEVAVSLDKLGRLLGTRAQADRAAADYRQRIAALRARYAARPPVTVFLQIWDRPLTTLNGAQIVSDVLRLCGGRNVFAALQPVAPTVSDEAVLAADPEAIVATAQGATASDASLPSLERWRRWPSLAAVARSNLFAVDGDWLTRPTPRLALGAEQVCRDLETARERRR